MVENKRIYLSPPHMSGREMKYIADAFDQNWVAPLGPNVDVFESRIAEYCGVKDAAALSSGTAAMHLALILLGVQPGDEVFAPTFTFSATINPIVYQGATPILIDSEVDTWNMDPELLEKAILDRLSICPKNRLKAIIVVHLYGMPAKMDEIMTIAKRYNLPIIEDAAEALGSRYIGKPLGSFGDVGVLSFNGNKIITTSGGGALISDNQKLIEKARYLSTQARDKELYYQHREIGYNYRMSNVLAGIGRGQMEIIDEYVNIRRENFRFYKSSLEEIDGIKFLDEPQDSFFSNRWLTTIILNATERSITWQKLQRALEMVNIESRPLWKPMHMQPVFETFPAYINGNSAMLFNNGLCLPSGSNMTNGELGRVIDAIRASYK